MPKPETSSEDDMVLQSNPTGPKYPLLNLRDDTKVPTDPQVGQFLRTIPLLTDFNEAECAVIGGALKKQSFSVGQPIVKQGDPAKGLFFLFSGSAKVTRTEGGDGKQQTSNIDLDLISSGDYFGEGALVSDAPRGANIIATAECIVLFLSREDYERLFVQKNGKSTLTFAKRGTIRENQSKSDGSSSVYEMRPPVNPVTAKDDKAQSLLSNSLKDQVLFTGMENEHKLRAIASMWKVTVPPDTIILRQGDFGDNFYVLESGKVGVYLTKPDGSLGRIDVMAKPGQSFGELALLYNTPRNATIKSKAKTTLWVLDRWTFRRLMRNVTEERLQQYRDFLTSVPLFQPLSNHERSRIAGAIETAFFRDGEEIIKEGERGDTMFIITEGVAEVSKIVDKKRLVLNTLNKSNFFGERSLIEGETRTATVTCIGRVEVAKIDLYTFKRLLGPVHEQMVKHAKESQQRDMTASKTKTDLIHLPEAVVAKAKQLPVILANQNPDIQPQDLEVIGFLGKGGYGVVELAKHVKTGTTFALKTLYRQHVMETKSHMNVLEEKKMLALMNSRHIIRLFATFKSKEKLQLVLEPCLGGDLYSLLRARGVLPERAARFYAASVILALEEIHNNGVVYRDLKPENILLDNEGFIKVTDFGLAKQLSTVRTGGSSESENKITTTQRTFTVCGTPHYLAPEVIQGVGHDRSVDLWCLGVLIYEMLAGRPPFYRPGEGRDNLKLYTRIVQCDYHPSSKFTETSWDLIQRLLQYKPSQRLSLHSLKKHSWFQGIDWAGMEHQGGTSPIRAPIIPYIVSSVDLKNINKTPPPPPTYDPSLLSDNPTDQLWDAEF